MSERKLASIQKIEKLHKLEEFDNLLLAEILGWKCLVKKDEFKEGDLCVYFEVDSMLPDRPEFEFMSKYKYRVKTIKMRGVYSQGLAKTLSILPAGEYKEDMDVTELLSVKKYEYLDDLKLAGNCKSTFPDFIFKTDEERIQTCKAFLKHTGVTLIQSEKVDGTSATYYLKDGEFGVCSRNQELKDDPNSVYWHIARKYDIENKLKDYNKNIAVQGEIVGPKVQKNKYKLTELQFNVFNIQNIDDRTYFNHYDLMNFCVYYSLNTVPILESIKIYEKLTVDKLVEMSKGYSVLNKDILREGIVLKAANGEHDLRHGRISFKVINPDFLIKYD